MSSIFICHSSVDKTFVEKLARDIKRLGINVWFDGWDIKVGDSITWKIEEGIRENEYLGIVLSPEALTSEWVRSEISSAWIKQITTKKIVILPILFRECEIPYFIQDRKYADFTEDYNYGFKELISVFGIKETEIINEENWRVFVKNKSVNWQKFREKEFERLVTILTDRAIDYNWSSWVGGSRNPYSVTFSAWKDRKEKKYISIKLNKKTNSFLASFVEEINPNNLRNNDYKLYVGNTINECEEFIWRKMEDFKQTYGNPSDKAIHFNERFLNEEQKLDVFRDLMKNMRWYKGEKL